MKQDTFDCGAFAVAMARLINKEREIAEDLARKYRRSYNDKDLIPQWITAGELAEKFFRDSLQASDTDLIDIYKLMIKIVTEYEISGKRKPIRFFKGMFFNKSKNEINDKVSAFLLRMTAYTILLKSGVIKI